MKTISAIIIFAVSAIAGDVNIVTQSPDKPDRIGPSMNPTPEQYRSAGWRHNEPLPTVADGYTRSPVKWVDSDGTNAIAYFADVAPPAAGYMRVSGIEWTNVGTPQVAGVYQDRLTSEIDAEAAAAQAQAEIDRQAAKSDALKGAENSYLNICQQLTGKRDKLGFAELEAIVSSLMATDPNTAVALTLRLLTIDAAGKREGGLKWWDDIQYHAEVTP